MKNEDGMAAVLGHEIGHTFASNTKNRFSSQTKGILLKKTHFPQFYLHSDFSFHFCSDLTLLLLQ